MSDPLDESLSEVANNVLAFPCKREVVEPAHVERNLGHMGEAKVGEVLASLDKFMLTEHQINKLSREELARQVGDLRMAAEKLRTVLEVQPQGVTEGDLSVLLNQALDQREAAQARQRTRLLVRAKKQRFWTAMVAVIPVVFAAIWVHPKEAGGSLSDLQVAVGVLAMVWCVVVVKMMPALPRDAVK